MVCRKSNLAQVTQLSINFVNEMCVCVCVYTHKHTHGGAHNMYNYVCVGIYTRHSSWNSNSNTLEPCRPQHDGPTACVIVQQYSSPTCFSLRLRPQKEKIRRVSKMLLFQTNVLTLKLPKSEIVN
jgi:hypothetical protein